MIVIEDVVTFLSLLQMAEQIFTEVLELLSFEIQHSNTAVHSVERIMEVPESNLFI